jgi:hypothetical protein
MESFVSRTVLLTLDFRTLGRRWETKKRKKGEGSEREREKKKKKDRKEFI